MILVRHGGVSPGQGGMSMDMYSIFSVQTQSEADFYRIDISLHN